MSRLRGDSVKKATELILNKIESYELMSGDVVSDLDLSKQINISRTPIREAIMNLLSNDILQRTQTRIIVKPITIKDIEEIIEVREAIETKSAEIILSRGKLTDKMKAEFTSIQEKMADNVSSVNFNKIFDDDNEFHKLIVKFSDNSRLAKINEQINLQSQRLRWISLITPTRYIDTISEHNKIIEMLLAEDVAGTIHAIKQHLNSSRLNYEQIVTNSQWDKISHEIKYLKSDNIQQ